MDGHPHLFSPSPLCSTCPYREPCGAELTDHACPEFWTPDRPGGEAVSHPLKLETAHEIRELAGIEFDDVVAQPSRSFSLPPYIPQARNRRSFRGYLTEPIYALRANDVVKAKHVIIANEMRDRLGLDADQQLILLLFDNDELLENMWGRHAQLVWQLAHAGYDLIVPPSFSTYTPRPRTEFLINARRSMIYYAALQLAGAPTIPRLAWQISHDARRFARWALANPSVHLVAIDWGTYRVDRDITEQLEGLATFDTATHHKLSYLINGITTDERCDALFDRVPPHRIHITNATTQTQIPAARIRPTGDQTGATFNARITIRRDLVTRAIARYQTRTIIDLAA